jgi:hypothetical protein
MAPLDRRSASRLTPFRPRGRLTARRVAGARAGALGLVLTGALPGLAAPGAEGDVRERAAVAAAEAWSTALYAGSAGRMVPVTGFPLVVDSTNLERRCEGARRAPAGIKPLLDCLARHERRLVQQLGDLRTVGPFEVVPAARLPPELRERAAGLPGDTFVRARAGGGGVEVELVWKIDTKGPRPLVRAFLFDPAGLA